MNSGTAEIASSEAELRTLGGWAADCAERALPLFEAAAPGDTRPREAIAAIRAFAAGDRWSWRLRTAAWAALKASHEVGDPAAEAAARAAASAAGTAYLRALAAAHRADHVVGPALHAAQALELAAFGDRGVGEGAVSWAIVQAPSAVCDILRRLPAARLSRTRLGELRLRLDTGLRDRPESAAAARAAGAGNSTGFAHPALDTPEPASLARPQPTIPRAASLARPDAALPDPPGLARFAARLI